MAATLSAAALAVALGGCAAVPADDAAAALATAAPAGWQAPLPHRGDAAEMARFWQPFDDPSAPPLLVPLIESAQAASPTLSSARSRIAQALASRVAAGAALQPALNASAGAQRSSADATLGTLSATTQLSGALAGAWELDLFGGNAAARAAAQARLEGAQALWHEARVAVAAEVATQYNSLRACEAQTDNSQLDAASRAETARLTELSSRAGFRAPADAALARASHAQASAQLTQQRSQCDLLVKGLVALTARDEPALRLALAAGRGRLAAAGPAALPSGRRPAAPPADGGGSKPGDGPSVAPAGGTTPSSGTDALAASSASWSLPSVLSLPGALAVPTVPAALLRQRPDLANAERDVLAARGDLAQTQAARLPRITLAGSIGAVRVETAGIHLSDTTWAIGPVTVSLPLFDGGTRRANAEASQARLDDALAQYAARLRTAVREVEEALVTLDGTSRRAADLVDAADGFAVSLRATEARSRGGLASLFELEDARRSAVGAQTALIDLRRDRLAAWIGLYRALGGGWTDEDVQRLGGAATERRPAATTTVAVTAAAGPMAAPAAAQTPVSAQSSTAVQTPGPAPAPKAAPPPAPAAASP